MKKILLVVGAIVLVLGLSLVSFYNSLIVKTQGIDNQWSQVEVQFQRRFDLIPNLVKSVEGIMKQEKAVFGQIAEARTRYSGAKAIEDKVKAASEFESAIGRLLVVMENYPQLRSAENVTQLMDELAGTENRISVERRRFNDLVKDYNTTIKMFPGNLAARILGFSSRSYFEAVSEAEKAPEVNINP